jgi:hypothetical protein
MKTLKINDQVYNLESPTDSEFRNQYITSFGDFIQPKVTAVWNHIDGFNLTLQTETEDEYLIKI